MRVLLVLTLALAVAGASLALARTGGSRTLDGEGITATYPGDWYATTDSLVVDQR